MKARGFGLISLLAALAVMAAVVFMIMKVYEQGRKAAGVKSVRYDEILKDAKKGIGQIAKERADADIE